MMKYTLWLLCLSLAWSACKKPVPLQWKHIPSSAQWVVGMNGERIGGKLAGSEDDLATLLKNTTAGADSMATLNEWSQLKEAGLALNNHLYVWAMQHNQQPDAGFNGAAQIMGAVALLNNQQQFEAYLNKKLPGTGTVQHKNFSYKYAHGNTMIGWNSEVVVMLQYGSGVNPAGRLGVADSALVPIPPSRSNVELPLRAVMETSFNANQKTSMGAVPTFASLASQPDDMVFWTSTNNAALPLPLPKLQQLAEGNITTGTINFENGKVAVQTKSYAGEALGNIFEKHAGPVVKPQLIERYPSSKINGFALFAFDPQVLTAIVQFAQVEGPVNKFLTDFMGAPFTLANALKAFSGDVAVVVSDVAAPAQKDSMVNGVRIYQSPKANMIFALPLADEAVATRMLDRMVAIGMAEKQNNLYLPKGVPPTFGLSAAVTNKMAIVASGSDILKAYGDGGGKAAIQPGMLDSVQGKAGVFFIDFHSIFTGLGTGAAADTLYAPALATFHNLSGHFDNYNGKFVQGAAQLTLRNQQQNSLRTLLHYLAVQKNTARSPMPAPAY